jgi:hypothetical protein
MPSRAEEFMELLPVSKTTNYSEEYWEIAGDAAPYRLPQSPILKIKIPDAIQLFFSVSRLSCNLKLSVTTRKLEMVMSIVDLYCWYSTVEFVSENTRMQNINLSTVSNSIGDSPSRILVSLYKQITATKKLWICRLLIDPHQSPTWDIGSEFFCAD